MPQALAKASSEGPSAAPESRSNKSKARSNHSGRAVAAPAPCVAPAAGITRARTPCHCATVSRIDFPGRFICEKNSCITASPLLGGCHLKTGRLTSKIPALRQTSNTGPLKHTYNSFQTPPGGGPYECASSGNTTITSPARTGTSVPRSS